MGATRTGTLVVLLRQPFLRGDKVKSMSTPTTKHEPESQSLNNSELDVQQELTYIASGTALMFGGTLFSNVISLVYGVLAARIVGAKLLGIFYLGSSVIGFIGPFAILALSKGGLFRYIPLFHAKGDFQAIRKTIRWVLSFVATISTLLTLFLFLLAKIIAMNWFHHPELTKVLVLLAITIPLGNIGSICLCSVHALHQIKYRVYVERFITPVFRLIVVNGLFLLGWRLMALVTTHVVSAILSLGMAGYYLWKVLQEQPHANRISQNVSMSQIVRFSVPLFLSSIFWRFPQNLITWLLGIFSAEAVAIYGIASRLKELGSYVLHSLNSVFVPMISGLFGSGQRKKLEALYKNATRWIVSLSIPIYLLMILLAQKFLYLYGEAFVVGAIPLVILCLCEIVNSSVGSAGNMVVMTGHPKIHLCNEIVTAIIITVLSFIAIPKYGVLGAALAVGIGVAFVNLIRLMEVYYFLRIHPYDWKYIKLILPVTIASLSLIGIQNFFPIRFPYNLIIYSLTFVGIYIGLLLVSGLSQEDIRLLQSIKLRIAGKFQKK